MYNTYTNTTTTKLPIDIYYIINMGDESVDVNFIETYLRVYSSINYNITRFENCASYLEDFKNEKDVIKRGLFAFNKMLLNLKLKTSICTNVWFLYISHGDIFKEQTLLYKDIDIILLNQNIHTKETMYNINQCGSLIDIKKNLSKELKLQKIQVLKNNLEELFSKKSIIKYNNFY
jgi:hypothetical protein